MDEVLIEKEKIVKKIDPVGLSLYGSEFSHWNRLAEMRDFIPAFKDFYYTERIKNPKITLPELLQTFNKNIVYPENRTFHPSTPQLRTWRKHWDYDIAQQRMNNGETAVIPQREIRQIIKTRSEDNVPILGAADDNSLEAGTRTLGGELLNDAMQMLRDDQALEELYDDETLIKRRNYIVNVFAHATKLVHGKAALMLKASEEKRNTAGFLMSLLSRATAGKMSDEEMGLLKSAYAPKQNEPQQPAHV